MSKNRYSMPYKWRVFGQNTRTLHTFNNNSKKIANTFCRIKNFNQNAYFLRNFCLSGRFFVPTLCPADQHTTQIAFEYIPVKRDPLHIVCDNIQRTCVCAETCTMYIISILLCMYIYSVGQTGFHLCIPLQ